MGKLKNRRQKLHPKAVKSDRKNTTPSAEQNVAEMETDNMLKTETSSLAQGGIFRNIDIDISKTNKDLPDFDACSAITSKSLRGLDLTKKEKRKLKHDLWMKKIDTIQVMRKEAKDREKRKATAVVGDMKPIEDALPTLELLLRDTSSQKAERPKPKARPVKKAKQRQKDMLHDIDLFHQVLKHPAFQKNPTATISEHLKNRMQQEDKDT